MKDKKERIHESERKRIVEKRMKERIMDFILINWYFKIYLPRYSHLRFSLK